MVLAPSYTDLLLRLGLSLATSTRPPKDVTELLIRKDLGLAHLGDSDERN